MKRRRPRQKRERRHHPRHPFRAEFKGQELSSLGSADSPLVFQGSIQNISCGGINVLTKRRLKETSLVRAEILLPQTPVSVPLLMQTRWIRRLARPSRYEAGLQFLI